MMFMAFHASAARRWILVALFLALLILGVGLLETAL